MFSAFGKFSKINLASVPEMFFVGNETNEKQMSREEFYALSDGMTDAQRASAFNFLHGELSVYLSKGKAAPTPEEIYRYFENACDFGRRVSQ
jgi:hypothetical protein